MDVSVIMAWFMRMCHCVTTSCCRTSSFSIGVYNALARKNAYNIYYVTEGEGIKGYKLSVFGTAIPYVSLNIRFN